MQERNLQETAKRMIEDIINNGYDEDKVSEMLYLASVSEGSNQLSLDESHFLTQFSQEECKKICDILLKEVQEKIKNVNNTYLLTGSLLILLTDLNSLEKLTFSNEKIKICKVLIPVLMDASTGEQQYMLEIFEQLDEALS